MTDHLFSLYFANKAFLPDYIAKDHFYLVIPYTNSQKSLNAPVLPLLESVIEKVLKEEQKLSREYISEKEAAGTNPAPTGKVPSKGVEKGMLGAKGAVGMAPRMAVLG